MTDIAPEFYRLALALAIGLILGAERGSREPQGGALLRIAGLRTFGLIGLLGGLSALLARSWGSAVLVAALLALVAIAAVGYWHVAARTGDLGATSEIAMFVAFALGALAVAGEPQVTAASAVVVAALLRFKEPLHAWLARISPAELEAALQLLIIGVVALPLLPDRGLGPWEALNPREVGWLVALIAGLSFSGYVAVKALGARRGLLLTALLGGLTSSTAVALSFARLARRTAPMRDWLAGGICVASAAMAGRLALEIGVVRTELLAPLAVPLALLALGPLLGAGLLVARAGVPSETALELQNPLALGVALRWALALAALSLIAAGASEWFGERGVLLVASVSGLLSVDAVSLSLARMAGGSLSFEGAARGIALAAIVNTLSKASLAAFVGGGAIGIRVGSVLALTASAAALAAF